MDGFPRVEPFQVEPLEREIRAQTASNIRRSVCIKTVGVHVEKRQFPLLDRAFSTT